MQSYYFLEFIHKLIDHILKNISWQTKTIIEKNNQTLHSPKINLYSRYSSLFNKTKFKDIEALEKTN